MIVTVFSAVLLFFPNRNWNGLHISETATAVSQNAGDDVTFFFSVFTERSH